MADFPDFLKTMYRDKFIEEENWSRTHAEGFDFFENVRINSDQDYISKALLKIKKHCPSLLESTGATSKSNEKSCAAREKANDFFKKKKWLPALKSYSKSIAFAENGSVELKLAYANRSALLIHRGFYKECLEDIDRALSEDYPTDKKPQLITRQEKARALLSTQIKSTSHETVPSLQSKNKTLHGATEAIQIAQDERYGRFIQATRDIVPGEILLIEEPYAQVTAQDFKTTHCGDCNNLCFNLIPCKRCSVEMYCSMMCRDKAYNEYHQYECIVLKYYPPEIFDIANIPREERNIGNINKEQLRQLALRVTLKGFKYYTSYVADNTEDFYAEIGKLQTHRSDLSKSALMILSFNLAKQFHILRRHTNFFSKLIFKDKEDILKYHLLRNRLICCFNTATIQYKLKEEIDNQTNVSPGLGLFSTYSYFNHACLENVGHGYYGSTLVARALRKIKKGEQCFINYGYFFHEEPKEIRHMNLSRHYLFTCKCIACEKDWKTLDKTLMSKENFCLNSSAFILLEAARAMVDEEKILDEETRIRALRHCEKIENMIKDEGPTVNLIVYYDLVYLIVVLKYQGQYF